MATFTGHGLSPIPLSSEPTTTGFTAEQLYQTASYRNHDLSHTRFDGNNMTGWDFSCQKLTGVSLLNTETHGIILDGADLRGVDQKFQSRFDLASSNRNLIGLDGTIDRLTLNDGEQFLLRDFDEPDVAPIPVLVKGGMTLAVDSDFRVFLDGADWQSTVSFEPDVDVILAGTLTLETDWRADDELSDLEPRFFQLFNWTGANVTGAFGQIVNNTGVPISTSRLYTTGEIRIVPEPTALSLLGLGVLTAMRRRRRP